MSSSQEYYDASTNWIISASHNTEPMSRIFQLDRLSNLRDETSSPHILYLENLQFKDLFCDEAFVLLASQTFTTLELSENGSYSENPSRVLNDIPFDFDLTQSRALRHIRIQRKSLWREYLAHLRFLAQLLFTSSSSGIETPEIEITSHIVEVGDGKDLFLSGYGWSSLDRFLSSQIFGSLNKVVLRLGLEIEIDSSSGGDFGDD